MTVFGQTIEIGQMTLFWRSDRFFGLTTEIGQMTEMSQRNKNTAFILLKYSIKKNCTLFTNYLSNKYFILIFVFAHGSHAYRESTQPGVVSLALLDSKLQAGNVGRSSVRSQTRVFCFGHRRNFF